MTLILHSSRICRNVCPLSISKYSALLLSSRAASEPRKIPQAREPACISVAESNQTRTLFANTVVNPDVAKPVVTESGVDNARRRKNVAQEPEWRCMEVDQGKLRNYCLMLSKIRLTSLVVVTAMGGYVLAPGAFDLYTFAACSAGTGLVSAAANAINQFFEVPFDAQMSRTKNRVLVRGYLTPAHAVIFAAVSGVAGLSLLYTGVNGLTAALGATNLVLYTLVYTPLKRISILNTWVGSVVGAIPPLMGWAGCVGDILSPGAWIMSGILYAWQFPHFNALSWNLRPDYSRAGYRMMAVTNPSLCRKTALRYTAGLMGLCYLAPLLDVTHWWFAVASTPLNGYFLYLAWKFYEHSDSGNSRRLFRFSLVHLPALMVLMLFSKKCWYTDEKQADTIPLSKETIPSQS